LDFPRIFPWSLIWAPEYSGSCLTIYGLWENSGKITNKSGQSFYPCAWSRCTPENWLDLSERGAPGG
jgi:hypothetical protein